MEMVMRRQCRSLVLVLAWMLCCVGGAAAQSGIGSITGTIIDQTGGHLAAAEIRIVESSTGATRTTISNESGLFTIPAVPPGTYTITITRDSFKSKQLDHITLNSFQQLSLGEVTLDVAVSPSDVVEVSASRPQLDIDSGVRTETIGAEQVQNMPLQGRNWATLLKVIPGSIGT